MLDIHTGSLNRYVFAWVPVLEIQQVGATSAHIQEENFWLRSDIATFQVALSSFRALDTSDATRHDDVSHHSGLSSTQD